MEYAKTRDVLARINTLEGDMIAQQYLDLKVLYFRKVQVLELIKDLKRKSTWGWLICAYTVLKLSNKERLELQIAIWSVEAFELRRKGQW